MRILQSQIGTEAYPQLTNPHRQECLCYENPSESHFFRSLFSHLKHAAIGKTLQPLARSKPNFLRTEACASFLLNGSPSRLMNHLPVRVAVFDGAEAEFHQLRLDLRAVSHANENHIAGMKIFLRHIFGIRRCHRIETPR